MERIEYNDWKTSLAVEGMQLLEEKGIDNVLPLLKVEKELMDIGISSVLNRHVYLTFERTRGEVEYIFLVNNVYGEALKQSYSFTLRNGKIAFAPEVQAAIVIHKVFASKRIPMSKLANAVYFLQEPGDKRVVHKTSQSILLVELHEADYGNKKAPKFILKRLRKDGIVSSISTSTFRIIKEKEYK